MTYQDLHNTDLEQSVLSALLFDNTIDFSVATDGLTAECFSNKPLRRLFITLQTMVSKGISIHDPMLVLDTLNRTEGDDPQMSLADFLQMVEGDSSRMQVAFNLPQYIGILIDLQRRREVYALLERTTGGILDMTRDSSETIDHLVSEVTTAGNSQSASILSFGDVMEGLQQTIQRNINGEGMHGIPTGFRRLDTTGGLHASDLIIIAADSSQGKTALATTIAMNIINHHPSPKE